MACSDIPWLAGLLDAEGWLGFAKSGTSTNLCISIGMTHLETMQKVSKILNTKIEVHQPTGQAKSISFHCRIHGTELMLKWVPTLTPLLFTKQEQCILLGEIASIMVKRARYSGYQYTIEEKIILNTKKARIKKLNKKGVEKSSRQLIPHQFSLKWVAGVLDGDGSIFTSKWRRARTQTNKRGKPYWKPVVKIGMNDKPTINYLSNWFGVRTKVNNRKTKKKATNYSVRLLSTKILNFMPIISEHLFTKQELGKLIIEYAELKRQGGTDAARLSTIKNQIYEINHPLEFV